MPLGGVGNIFDDRMRCRSSVFPAQADKIFDPRMRSALLRRLFAWQRAARTSTLAGGPCCALGHGREGIIRRHGPSRAWRTGSSSGDPPRPVRIEGRVRYQGGDLLAKLATTPEQLTPDDFRLRPDSAGYRAGKDGKDLGADVDLVGPGPAYERWKKTPEYQQWLKDTGQVKAEAPKPEPKAFVVLGGKGVAERKFDTLAEAVQRASDGDTIEIRGNGPFVSRADQHSADRAHDPGRRGLPAGHQAESRSDPAATLPC